MTELTPDYLQGLMCNVPPLPELDGAITVTESDPGCVRYEIDVPQSMANYHNTVHGGCIALMFEIGTGMATYAYGVDNVALQSSINFIRAVKPQRLVISAHSTHKGRTTSVCHLKMETMEGKLVAEATYTMFILGPLPTA